MEKYYHFAGIDLAVRIPEKWMYTEEGQLASFRTERVKDPHVFDFELADTLDEPKGEKLVSFPGFRVYRQSDGCVRYIGTVENGWENAYIRAEHHGKQHRIQLKASQFTKAVGIKTVLNALEAEHLVLETGGVIFHSSYIHWQGKGILFTAPSETGKSTQADLWHELRSAEIINGDRSVIRVVDGKVFAEGIPFAGSSQYCQNRTLPLAAIVYLQQAPVTSIRKLRGAQAFCRIWEGCSVNTWDKGDVKRASGLVEQVISKVPVFCMPCTPDESAVIALEQALRKLEKQ